MTAVAASRWCSSGSVLCCWCWRPSSWPAPRAPASHTNLDRADALAPVGMPRSTRCHWPSRSTRYAAKAQGMPCARSGSAESISWKCRWGAVELPAVADPPQHLAGADLLAPGDGHAARHQVGVQRVGPGGLGDHVVTGKPRRIQPPPCEPHRGLHRRPGLPRHMQPLALGHAVHHLDDHAVQGRMDGLSPAVVVPCPPPDRQPAQGPRGVQVEPGTVVGADQVVGVPLPEHIGAVARDPVRRGPLDRPLASKGELDDHRVIELTHGCWPDARSRLLSSGSPGSAPALMPYLTLAEGRSPPG